MLALAFLIPLLLVACGEEKPVEPQKDTPPPPPEPSVSEIKMEFQAPLAPIQGLLQAGQPIPPEMSAQVMQQLSGVQTKFTGKKNLEQAKSECASAVEGFVKQGVQMQYWAGVLTACDILAFFDANNPTLGPAREQAIKELSRPILGKPSFITDRENNITTVFINVTFPDKGVQKSFQMREGEDFADGRFRLLKIIGRNQGVQVLDVEDGKQMDIMRRERE
jgi:hypothetical protein